MCMYFLGSVLLCFCMKMMFGSSLPPAVCKKAHILLTLLCLFAHSSVQNILCYVFVLLVFVLCVLCCQLLWIVHLRLFLRYSLTFYDLLEQTFRLFAMSREYFCVYSAIISSKCRRPKNET